MYCSSLLEAPRSCRSQSHNDAANLRGVVVEATPRGEGEDWKPEKKIPFDDVIPS